MFRECLSVPISGVRQLDCWSLECGTDRLSRNVVNYHWKLCNILEEQGFQVSKKFALQYCVSHQEQGAIVFKKYSEDGIQLLTVGTSGGILSTWLLSSLPNQLKGPIHPKVPHTL